MVRRPEWDCRALPQAADRPGYHRPADSRNHCLQVQVSAVCSKQTLSTAFCNSSSSCLQGPRQLHCTGEAQLDPFASLAGIDLRASASSKGKSKYL